MKKLLGLLALTVTVSGVAAADQDVLKSINASSEIRQEWTDKHGTDANEIGNAGFKKENKGRLRWRNIVSGELTLVDEWDLNAKFKVQNDQDKWYDTGKLTSARGEDWETNFQLSKPITFGSLETSTALGWTHKAYRKGTEDISKTTVGQSNEIYFGPTFNLNVLGQNLSTTLQLVYFDSNGDKDADYAYDGKEFERGKTEGWGINNQFATSGDILDTSFGKVGYYIELNNKLRDGKGKIAATGKSAGSSIYLDYIVGATYTSPSFAGFYGQLNLENEWEKHTAKTGYTNGFSVWTNAGYKVALDTPVGEVSINPFVKYRPIHRETKKDNSDSELAEYGYKRTTETNELRAGLAVGLTVK